MELANLFYTPVGCALLFSVILYFCMNCTILYKILIRGEWRLHLKKMLVTFVPLFILGLYEILLFIGGEGLLLSGSLSLFSVKLFICTSFFIVTLFQSAGFVDDKLKNGVLYQLGICIAVLAVDLLYFIFKIPVCWYVLLLSVIIIFVIGLFVYKFFQICMQRFDTMIQILKKRNFIGAFVVVTVGLFMSYVILVALFLHTSMLIGFISLCSILLLHILLFYKEYKASSISRNYKIVRGDAPEDGMLMDGAVVDDYKIIQRLILHFESHKPYLHKDLKLADVSKQIYTNRTYLSRALNQSLSKNFNQFVNYYRVKEACRLYIDNPLIKINEMSEKSGFKNLSSFSTAFSFNMRYTPAEWCKEVKRRLNNNEHVCIEDYFK